MTNLLLNSDWTRGSTTPFTDPAHGNVVRGNMRVPNFWYFSFLEGLIPRLPEQELDSPWLPPELTFRSADGRRYSETDTELIPESEVGLYLAPGVPVVYHIFKAYGIQWWRLGINGSYLAQTYRFGIELFNDVYFGRDGQKVPPDDPRSMEWRIRLGTDSDIDPPFMPSAADFRHWYTIERTFAHPGGALDVSLEVRARWGVDVVGAFLRRPSFTVASSPSPTPPPVTPPPFPTPPPPAGSAPTDRAAALVLQNLIHQQLNLAQMQLNAARENMQALGGLIDRVIP